MRLWCAGFNGFGQWGDLGHEISQFTLIDTNAYLKIKKNNVHFDVGIEWGYNIFVLDSKIIIKGYHKDNFDQSKELSKPADAIFTDCICNDKFILFYNKKEKYVWKYHIEDVEQEWVKLSNFLDVERRVNNEKSIANNSESILKIVSSVRMNIALTTTGRLFNIPNKINTRHCRGKIIDVHCGHEHAILLTDQGNVYTWGNGSRCQLGHGDTKDQEQPELVKGLAGIRITKVAAGGWHCCAVSGDGDLYTWGWNEKGQLGIYVFKNKISNSDLIKHKRNYAGCSNESLDKTSDSDDCQPNKKPKNLDENIALPNYALPQLIDIYDEENCAILEKNILDVDCGSKHTIVKLDDNTFWGAGCNQYGQLGFDNEQYQYLNIFTRLNVNAEDASIRCGVWTSVLMSKN